MALNTFKVNYLTPLQFKGLRTCHIILFTDKQTDTGENVPFLMEVISYN